jgi:hypothetical protein
MGEPISINSKNLESFESFENVGLRRRFPIFYPSLLLFGKKRVLVYISLYFFFSTLYILSSLHSLV